MNVIKRATVSLIATLDKAVSHIEDHDALVSAQITTVSQHIAASTVEVNKLERQMKQLVEQISGLQRDAAGWEKRAVSVMQNDREKALLCLKRKNACDNEISLLTEQQQKQKALHHDMAMRLNQMKAQLANIKCQQTQLRNRSSQAEIQRIAQQVDGLEQNSLDNIFTRWETKLTHCEVMQDAVSSDYSDSFEHEFLEQEENLALNNQLEALLKQGLQSDATEIDTSAEHGGKRHD